MSNIGKWNAPGTLTTVLSTELNSLANGSVTAASSAYNNASNLDLYVNVEIFLNTLSPAAGGYVALYYTPTLDGTNYADVSGNYTAQILCQHGVDAGTSVTRRLIIPNVLLTAAQGKFYLLNGTGVSLNASGNTVKVIPANINLNG